MKYAGNVLTKKQVTKSRNLWGDVSEIEAVVLPVIERNEYGDCLCYLEGKGIVDIDSSDVRTFIPNPMAGKEPMEEILNMLKDLGMK